MRFKISNEKSLIKNCSNTCYRFTTLVLPTHICAHNPHSD